MNYFAGTIVKCIIATVFAFVLSASNSLTFAADYTIVAKVSHAYEPGGSSTEVIPLPNINSQVGSPFIYQVDFYINATGFNSGLDQRGFGNITLDISHTAGLGNTSPPVWQPNAATVDSNGGAPGGTIALWDDNADFNLADLQDIVVSIATIPSPNVADPRPHVGEAPSLSATNLIGSIYIDWNGLGIQTLTATPEKPSFAHANGAFALDPGVVPPGAFLSAGQPELDLNATLHSGIVVFGVPEPSTYVLIGMVLPILGLLASRARRKNALNA